MRFLLRVLTNSLAIYLAAYFIPGVTFSGDWKILLIAGLALSLINLFIKPILKLVSLPFIVITLGFFSIVINIFLVWLLTKLIPELSVSGFLAFFFLAIMISAANIISGWLTRKPKKA